MRALILAAGKGTRLMSEQFQLPKVLREIDGKPIISYVLKNIGFIAPSETVLVVGYKSELVQEAIGGEYKYALQTEQKGTGHAVMAAEGFFDGYEGDVIILYGDMPMFTEATYKALIKKHTESGADLTLLSAVVDNKLAYGRIIRDADGNVCDIVEQKDATEEQKLIKELNVGVYVAKSDVLFNALTKIGNNNAQGEYYLTDVPKILIAEGKSVESHIIYNPVEIVGVNTPEDLAFCEAHIKEVR